MRVFLYNIDFYIVPHFAAGYVKSGLNAPDTYYILL